MKYRIKNKISDRKVYPNGKNKRRNSKKIYVHPDDMPNRVWIFWDGDNGICHNGLWKEEAKEAIHDGYYCDTNNFAITDLDLRVIATVGKGLCGYRIHINGRVGEIGWRYIDLKTKRAYDGNLGYNWDDSDIEELKFIQLIENGMVSHMEKWENEIIKTAEDLGWTVFAEENEYTFMNFSPKGRDLDLTIRASSRNELVEKVLEFYNDYDVFEEARIWLDITGHRNICLDDVKYVSKDIEDWKNMVRDFWKALIMS